MTDTVSIPYPEDDHRVSGVGAYRILEAFGAGADEAVLERVRTYTRRALQDFPELTGKTVTVGRLDPDEDVNGQAWFYNFFVCYPADRPTRMITVYHELAHLAIHVLDERGEDVPISSEEFCSIFAVARMVPELIDRDTIAYLGEPSVPREEWPEICRRALAYREERGANSHYIQQCKVWLEI